MIDLRLGDCLEVMKTLLDNSVDAVITDPPYYHVKDEAWDRQWDNPAKFLEWIGQLCEQWQRILKPNGSLYVFASPQMAARVETIVAQYFSILNNITWCKNGVNGGGSWSIWDKSLLRHFCYQKEEIIFAEHPEAGKCLAKLRDYFYNAFQQSGLSKEDIIAVFRQDGRYSSEESARVHASYKIGWGNGTRWDLCDSRLYEALASVLPLSRGYEDLRREYEDLRRPFRVSADVPYTDVWTFPTVAAYPGKHSCEKPLAMMEHIVKASTRPGAVVLDCCMGSGVTGLAAQKLGRDFIGIDSDSHWVAVAEKRIAEAQLQLRLEMPEAIHGP